MVQAWSDELAVAMALKKALGMGRGVVISSGRVAEQTVATLVKTKPPSSQSLENLRTDRRDLE